MTTISIPKDLKEDLAFHKKDGETWAEFLEQFVDILAGEEITRQEAPPEAKPTDDRVEKELHELQLAVDDVLDEVKDNRVMIPGRSAKETVNELEKMH